MQKAEVVLSVLRERGRKGLPLTQLYRQMFNKDLYLLAYGNIYSNQGAMTPGSQRGNRRRHVRGKDRPDHGADAARAVPVLPGPPRSTSRRRTAGSARSALPTWSDKLVGEVVRLLLEAYYEPRILRPVARVPERARVSHRTAGDPRDLDRDHMVYRG